MDTNTNEKHLRLYLRLRSPSNLFLFSVEGENISIFQVESLHY